jgi:hypothetical protein
MITWKCDEHWKRQEMLSLFTSVRYASTVSRIDQTLLCASKSSYTRPFMRNTSPMSKQATTFATMQGSYIVSRIHYLLEHSTARQTPCLPSCKGTASHVRYECTQFTSRHHLLYSNLIPQHPVPLASMSPNRSHQHPQHPRASPVAPFSPHLKDCPLYSRKPFCFSIFFCRSVTHRSPDLPTPSQIRDVLDSNV